MNSEENILVKFHFGALSFEINDAEKICCNFTMKIRDLVKKSKQSMSSEQLQNFKKEVDDTVSYFFRLLVKVEFFTYNLNCFIPQRVKHVEEIRLMCRILKCWLKDEDSIEIQYIKHRLKSVEDLCMRLESANRDLIYIHYGETYEDILY
mgnify:CR=1 FL=1